MARDLGGRIVANLYSDEALIEHKAAQTAQIVEQAAAGPEVLFQLI
jgi:hypothetical protein